MTGVVNMKVRLGYVAIALALPKVTASSQVTYKHYSGLTTEQKLNKLKKVTLSNLEDLQKILKYNIDNNIHFYRVTSKLIPLATHPEVIDWDYNHYFNNDFKKIGEIVKDSKMRIDTHPDQFNVINSINPDVVQNTIRNLLYHVEFFNNISYDIGKMVIHIGSGQGGKDNSIKRFIDNFRTFPKEITNKLILENDDKLFTAKDVLTICQELKVPMVLDIHHHKCNNNEENIFSLMEEILDTWNDEVLLPKLHISSPRNKAFDRTHSDYINVNDFITFIEGCKEFNRDMDIMIEAKKKDLALFKLIEEVKEIRKDWVWIDQTTFEV